MPGAMWINVREFRVGSKDYPAALIASGTAGQEDHRRCRFLRRRAEERRARARGDRTPAPRRARRARRGSPQRTSALSGAGPPRYRRSMVLLPSRIRSDSDHRGRGERFQDASPEPGREHSHPAARAHLHGSPRAQLLAQIPRARRRAGDRISPQQERHPRALHQRRSDGRIRRHADRGHAAGGALFLQQGFARGHAGRSRDTDRDDSGAHRIRSAAASGAMPQATRHRAGHHARQ